jgi:hypothetical protein
MRKLRGRCGNARTCVNSRPSELGAAQATSDDERRTSQWADDERLTLRVADDERLTLRWADDEQLTLPWAE